MPTEVMCKEQLARLEKALTIADALQAAGIGTRDLQLATEADWRLAAEFAEFRNYVPSEATRVVVRRLLGNREQAAERIRKVKEESRG